MGTIDYLSAWDLQRELANGRAEGANPDTLLMLEHPSVYTAGKRTAPEDRPQDGTPVIDVDRGGKITWHGPGQIVGYPILQLCDPIDVVDYVRRLEEAMIGVCEQLGVRDPAEVTLELLAAFGTVTGTPGRRITPLGRWALSVIGTRGVALLGSSDDAEEDGTYQLKIALQHVRPACWRRVLMSASATLGELHEVIQVAFAWDDDHLHGFTVGRRRYGDPYFDFEYDEHEITLATAFARTRKPITYTYDFGDDWRHEITLEKVVEPAPAATDPICVDGRGDAPVEDCGDDEAAWIAFDKVGINTRLARLGGGGQEAQARLRDDIEVILTDAYGEAEQMTAFQTVLDEEIDFPVPATLLGNPVVVTGLVEDDATLELRARCKGKHAKGLVSFADLEFRPGTVESWLHAAYVTYLGRSPSGVTPPSTWDGLTRWLS